MVKSKRLGDYIEKWHIKKAEWKGVQTLEVLGVSNVAGITKTAHKNSKDLSNYLVIQPDTFAYNPYRINVGSVGLTPKDTFGLVSPAYTVFKVIEGELIPELLLDFLKSFDGLQQINKYARGTVRKALRYDDLCKIEVTFPDFEEQKNIFEKKLIVEGKINDLSSEIHTKKQLLTNLKQAILQEAIQGELTEDWRASHPKLISGSHSAEILLKRIKKEKKQLIAGKKIKKEKPLPPITQEEIPFELPKGWVWCKFGDYTIFERGRFSARPRNDQSYFGGDIPFIQIGSLTLNGEKINSYKQTLNERGLKVSKLFPKDTITIAIVGGTIGYLGVLEQPMCFPDSIVGVKPNKFSFQEFVFLLLKANQNYIRKLSYQMAGQPNIKLPNLNNILIPLPPLEEQKEIVKKVEALMQKCTTLEEEIKQSETNAQMLMQAVLKEAFEG